MANSHFDDNHRPTLTGVLNTDGLTIMNAVADSTTHALHVISNTSSTNHGPTQAKMDDNHIPIGMVVSSSDFVTPVAIYMDSSGNILTN